MDTTTLAKLIRDALECGIVGDHDNSDQRDALDALDALVARVPLELADVERRIGDAPADPSPGALELARALLKPAFDAADAVVGMVRELEPGLAAAADGPHDALERAMTKAATAMQRRTLHPALRRELAAAVTNGDPELDAFDALGLHYLSDEPEPDAGVVVGARRFNEEESSVRIVAVLEGPGRAAVYFYSDEQLSDGGRLSIACASRAELVALRAHLGEVIQRDGWAQGELRLEVADAHEEHVTKARALELERWQRLATGRRELGLVIANELLELRAKLRDVAEEWRRLAGTVESAGEEPVADALERVRNKPGAVSALLANTYRETAARLEALVGKAGE